MSEVFQSKHPDLPFDMNALVNSSMIFDQLKTAIEYLLDQMQKQNHIIDKMDKEIRSRTYLIDKCAKDNSKQDKEIEELMKKMQAMEDKSVDMENKIFQNDADLEAFKMNVQMNL